MRMDAGTGPLQSPRQGRVASVPQQWRGWSAGGGKEGEEAGQPCAPTPRAKPDEGGRHEGRRHDRCPSSGKAGGAVHPDWTHKSVHYIHWAVRSELTT